MFAVSRLIRVIGDCVAKNAAQIVSADCIKLGGGPVQAEHVITALVGIVMARGVSVGRPRLPDVVIRAHLRTERPEEAEIRE